MCPLEPLLSTVRPQIPKGTFIVIIEGELALEGLRVKGERNSRRTMAEEALAVRKAGDFFRVGAGGPAMKRSKAASMLADPVIRTTQSSVLLMLSPQALNKVLGRKAGEWVAMLQEMMNHDLYDLLGRVPCFAPLDDQLRSAIAQLFSFEVLAPGKTLFSEGDDGDRFCILLHGEVDVVCEGKKLVTRVPQAFIGEIALLYNCTRTSSVVSTGSVCSFLSLRKARSAVPRAEQPRMSPAHTLRLAQEHFSSMMERVPEMASIVEGQQRQRIVYQSMKQSGLYTEDDTEESTADHCAAMAPLMRVRSVCEGEEVLAEGAPPAQFYVVFQGRLAARRAGTTYMPGHHVGGDAMLLHHPHADTIVAQTAGLLLEVRGDQFFSLLELQPRLMCEFELRILASSTRLEAVLHLPRAFVAFSAFGKAEFAEENLQFYAAASAFAVIAERRLDQLAEETRDGASLRVSKKKRTSGANKSNVPKSLDSSPTLGALGAAFVASSFVKSADRDADVPARAAELVDLYIRDGADRQVNVPSAVQRAVEKSLAAADVTEVLFEAARLEIIALMRRDTFKRFVTTDEFTALRDEISAPEKTPCPAKGPLALPEARSAWQVAYGAVPEAQAAPTFKEELLERTAAAGEKKAEEATPATAVLKQRRASAEQRAKNDGELRYVMISVPVAEGVSFDWTVDDKLYSFKAPEDARVGEEHEFTFRESDAITKARLRYPVPPSSPLAPPHKQQTLLADGRARTGEGGERGARSAGGEGEEAGRAGGAGGPAVCDDRGARRRRRRVRLDGRRQGTLRIIPPSRGALDPAFAPGVSHHEPGGLSRASCSTRCTRSVPRCTLSRRRASPRSARSTSSVSGRAIPTSTWRK